LIHNDLNYGRLIHTPGPFSSEKKLLNGKLLIEEEYDSKSKRLNGVWRVTTSEINHSGEYSVRIYSADELISMFNEAGFRYCRAFGAWDGSGYELDSNDIIAVARK
jgi:hypothetical protein